MQSLGVTGGFSGAVIWKVLVAGNQLCLRRWPQVHPSLNGLLAMHGLLEHVATAGFDLVPVPLTTRYGESYFLNEDHLWELTPWMPGEPALSQAPSEDKLSAAMTAVAKFHQAAQDYQFQQQQPKLARSPGLQDRFTMLQDLRKGGLQQLWQATRAAQASDLRELAFELLEGIGRSLDQVAESLGQLVEIPLPLQWCLRDVRHDHVLFAEDEVSGLLDFGAVAVDSVAGDVARLWGRSSMKPPSAGRMASTRMQPSASFRLRNEMPSLLSTKEACSVRRPIGFVGCSWKENPSRRSTRCTISSSGYEIGYRSWRRRRVLALPYRFLALPGSDPARNPPPLAVYRISPANRLGCTHNSA